MKVTEVRTYLINKDGRYGNTIVQVLTDEGISGIGECTVSDWGLAVGGAVHRMAEKFVIGEDPRNVEKLWDDIYRGSFWGRGGGPILTAALSGIEEACWDIYGKSLNLPAYMLLGGKVRDKIRCYANGWYMEARATGNLALYGKQAERVVEEGFTALKFDPFIEQLDSMNRGIPDKILDRAHIRRVVDRVRVVREAVGPDMDIIIEVHGWLNANTAILVGKQLAEYDIYFYEEPVDATNVELMRRVREECGVPVATGERIYSHWGFREVIEKQAADLLQPDINLTGGLLETKKIAIMADAYQIPIQPHNCWGPIASAAAIQLDACTPNFLIQEWRIPNRDPKSPFNQQVIETFESRTKDGYVPTPTEPGLGVELNEEYMKQFLWDTVKA